MSRRPKRIDELREESETATSLYKEYQSPYLHEKAVLAKRKLDNALKGQLKQQNFEPLVKIQPLF